MHKPFSANNHWNIYGLHVFKSRNDLKYGGCLGVSHFNKFEMRRRDTSIFDCSGFVGTGLWFPKWRTQCNTHRVGVLESWVVVWPDATSFSKKNFVFWMQKDAGFGPFGLWPWIWAPCCSATIQEKKRETILFMVQLRHGYPDLPEFPARSFGQVYKVCADVDGTGGAFSHRSWIKRS